MLLKATYSLVLCVCVCVYVCVCVCVCGGMLLRVGRHTVIPLKITILIITDIIICSGYNKTNITCICNSISGCQGST